MSGFRQKPGITHLDVRAIPPKPKFTQPTNVMALTSTFTPPSSCLENRLSMLPPLSFIWVNEPVPVPNNTVAACYPPEFMTSYTRVDVVNAGGTTITSSIVPAMSPFVCPKSWCTVQGGARNYIACCPSGYNFHEADTTVDPNRPAYGGTCFSDLPVSTNVPVIGYNEGGDTSSKVFSQTAKLGQAFARPIDGWALTSPTIIGCPISSTSISSGNIDSNSAASRSTASRPSASSAQSASENSTSSLATPSSPSLSIGAIVGASIGGCFALVALIGLTWFLLARRRRNNPRTASPDSHTPVNSHVFGASNVNSSRDLAQHGAVYYRHEAPSAHIQEKDTGWQPAQFGDAHPVYEMQAEHARELAAGEVGKGGAADKVTSLGRR